MPAVRRSSRASSAVPQPKPQSKAVEKPAGRAPRSQPARKRAASPERVAAPASKRTKTTDVKPSENDDPTPQPKPASRTAAAKKTAAPAPARKQVNGKLATIKEAPAPVPQQKPYFNPLPTPSPKHRPAPVLFVWGAGNFGQFGMGPDALGEVTKPRRNPWVEQKMQEGAFGEVGAGFEAIEGGGLHSLFLDENGTVWTSGTNDNAALGRITENVEDPQSPGTILDVDELTSVPHPLQSLVDEKFRAVKIAAGDSISAAISSEGELRVWGTFRADEGALGFGDGLQHQFTPVPILSLPSKPGDAEKVTSMANGSNHLVVLTTHGNIYTWGAGEHSQLGRRVIERRKIHGTVPEKITLGNRSRKAVLVGSGTYHSFAVDDKGVVWGWGLNTVGQTGTGHSGSIDDEVHVPKRVIGMSKEELGGDHVVSICGGEHHTLFLTAAGKVYACGLATGGRLGLAESDDAFTKQENKEYLDAPSFVRFPYDDGPIVRISVGSRNNAAVTKDGVLYTWGQGTQSELGVEDVEVKTPRVIVRRDGGWFAVDVSCGGQHTLGLFKKRQ